MLSLTLKLTTVYIPTETFQYTHYTSCHPPNVNLRGFIKGEAIRLLGTNSSEKFAGISL